MSQTAKQHYQRGKQLYEEEQYTEAANELRRAYALSPHPMILYNIALAEWRAGQWEAALHAAIRARDEGVDPGVRPQLEARIAALQTAIAARNHAESLDAEASTRAQRDELEAPSASEPSGFGAIGWTGTGMTAVGVGLGGGALFINQRLANEAEFFEAAARRGDREEYEHRLSDLEQRQFVGRLVAAGGIALTATGLTLLIIELSDGSADQPRRTTRLIVEPGGLGFSWSF